MAPHADFRSCVLLSALAALANVACEAEPPFEVKYESERLRIGTNFTGRLCQEEIITYEAHLDALEGTFGVSREFAWLYLYEQDQREEIADDCGLPKYGDELLGCWVEPVARSTLPSVAHELVHAWMETAESDALPWLAEGIAVSMSGPVQRANGSIVIEDLLSTTVSPTSYRRAGHFATWLIARYGVERFMSLYTGISGGTTPTELRAAFMDVLGSEAEDVLLEYETSAKEYYPGMGAYACGRGEPITWVGDAATWEAGGSCAEGLVRGRESVVQMQRVIVDVPLSGVHVLDVRGQVASLTYCLRGPADAAELPVVQYPVSADWQVQEALGTAGGAFAHDWDGQSVVLEAGTYEIWIDRTVEEGTIEVPRAMSLRKI